MKKSILAIVALLAASFATPSLAVSPWLPEQGALNSSMGIVYQGFNKFYRGTTESAFPAGDLDQFNVDMNVEYGILDQLSMDMTLGWVGTANSTTGVNVSESGGLNDVNLGLSYKLMDEFADDAWYAPGSWYAPSVAVRLGGIIAGTYDDAIFPFNAGDKASGVEAELGLGKLLPYGFGTAAAFGYRWRDNDVPQDWRFRADLFYSVPTYTLPRWLESVTASTAYDQVTSFDGVDLGVGPEGTPGNPAFKAQRLREDAKVIEAGVGVQDSGGRFYNVFYAHTLAGRNTGKKDIVGLVISVPWDLN